MTRNGKIGAKLLCNGFENKSREGMLQTKACLSYATEMHRSSSFSHRKVRTHALKHEWRSHIGEKGIESGNPMYN
eukprot:scaffold62611_cov33-Tisochrysis_lutea.AAC.1